MNSVAPAPDETVNPAPDAMETPSRGQRTIRNPCCCCRSFRYAALILAILDIILAIYGICQCIYALVVKSLIGLIAGGGTDKGSEETRSEDRHRSYGYDNKARETTTETKEDQTTESPRELKAKKDEERASIQYMLVYALLGYCVASIIVSSLVIAIKRAWPSFMSGIWMALRFCLIITHYVLTLVLIKIPEREDSNGTTLGLGLMLIFPTLDALVHLIFFLWGSIFYLQDGRHVRLNGITVNNAMAFKRKPKTTNTAATAPPEYPQYPPPYYGASQPQPSQPLPVEEQERTTTYYA